MKKALTVSLSILLIICFTATMSMAAEEKERGKFGIDDRHKIAKRVKFKPSTKEIKWKMVTPWSKGLLYQDIAVHFCDSVRLATAGRFNIKPFSAGELVPAMQAFDTVSKGAAQCGHGSPTYEKGKNEALVAFGAVPFGLDSEGYDIWLHERDGMELLQELYGRFNLYALPCCNLGQEQGLSSNKRATKLEDFKGMRLRTVGWFMDIMQRAGASVTPLPGGEVYLALERGVIDAAEFSSPCMTYPMGFDQITKYCIEPGIHQPGDQDILYINMDAWNKLPEDLQWIVKICARETQAWSTAWINNLNAEAIHLLKKNLEFVQMDEETLNQLRKTTQEFLNDLKAKNPDVKKVLDSQDAFLEDFVEWREIRGGVAPWPYEMYISGKHYQ